MSVEERLAILEQEVAELKRVNSPGSPKPNWLGKIAGTFKDDPEFGEILRLGQEIRKAEKLDEADGEV